jgi:hypothetical protein
MQSVGQELEYTTHDGTGNIPDFVYESFDRERKYDATDT